MNILSLETSGRDASLATLRGEPSGARLLQIIHLPGQRRTARELAPGMRELIAASHWVPQDIGLVTVSIGPGSFTGLRIGITAAKIFAYAVGAEILGIATLRAVALQTFRSFNFQSASGLELQESSQSDPSQSPCPGQIGRPAKIHVAMNAERGQVFVACYTRNAAGNIELVDPIRILDTPAWIRSLTPIDVVTGPALEKLAQTFPRPIRVARQVSWLPSAATIGDLGWTDYQGGRRDDLWELTPQYHRPSAAEEKRGY